MAVGVGVGRKFAVLPGERLIRHDNSKYTSYSG